MSRIPNKYHSSNCVSIHSFTCLLTLIQIYRSLILEQRIKLNIQDSNHPFIWKRPNWLGIHSTAIHIQHLKCMRSWKTSGKPFTEQRWWPDDPLIQRRKIGSYGRDALKTNLLACLDDDGNGGLRWGHEWYWQIGDQYSSRHVYGFSKYWRHKQPEKEKKNRLALAMFSFYK